MRALRLSLNDPKGHPRESADLLLILVLMFVFAWAPLGWAESDVVTQPLKNAGFLLIEKEMIRLSDTPRKMWSKKEKENYRALIFLENYFLNRGVTSWAMKVLHKLVRMRDNVQDLKKKAFLDCEAWRVLDHDLKNYENKALIEKLKKQRKFTTRDHIRFRKISSNKVSSCIGFIGSDWVWNGPDYTDQLYDMKTQNAVKSVQTFVKIKKTSLK